MLIHSCFLPYIPSPYIPHFCGDVTSEEDWNKLLSPPQKSFLFSPVYLTGFGQVSVLEHCLCSKSFSPSPFYDANVYNFGCLLSEDPETRIFITKCQEERTEKSRYISVTPVWLQHHFYQTVILVCTNPFHWWVSDRMGNITDSLLLKGLLKLYWIMLSTIWLWKWALQKWTKLIACFKVKVPRLLRS